jgi:molybdopterin-guanine dinucleotide biosynthesis protein A
MQQDKALLRYAGQPQVLVAYEQVRALVSTAFVSCRAGQWEDANVNALPQLHDTLDDVGPLGGILRAFEQQPDAAWLVVACDLPYLTQTILGALIANRDPTRKATAFRAPDSGLPEPVCAIYEPAIAPRLEQYLSKGIRCPRKMLLSEDTALFDLPDPEALINVNHPEEFEKARTHMRDAL